MGSVLRVLLVNAYADDNKGSAALTISALRQISNQFPDAHIGVVPLQQGGSDDPAKDFRHTLTEFPTVEVLPPLFVHERGRWGTEHALVSSVTNRLLNPTTRRHLMEADLVVSRGGVIFHAREGDRSGLASLLVRTLPTRLSSSAGVPTVLYGAQFGPFPGRLSRRAVRYSGGKNVVTLVRDHASYQNFVRICRRTPHVMPDSVFALDGGTADRPARAGRLAVVVSAHVLGDVNRQSERIGRLAKDVCEATGIEAVTLFNHVHGSILESAAAETAASYIQRHSDLECEIDERDLSPGELQREYQSSGLVLSSRLHAVVLALSAGVPALSVPTGVTFKERAVLSEVGLADYVVGSSAEAVRLAALTLDPNSNERHRLRRSIEGARTRLAEAGSALRATLSRNGDVGASGHPYH